MTFDLSVFIDPNDLKEAKRATKAFQVVLGDPENTHRVVLPGFFLEHMRLQFATDGRHGGKQWANYSSERKYAAFKMAVAGHLRILEFGSGPNARLKRSLTESGHPEHAFQARGDYAVIGSRVPYAQDVTETRTNRFGERSTGRDVLAMTSRQEEDLLRKFADEYDRRMERLF
jgi:hypothetical protein